eukprot:TRINITY_DN68418_c0_g1_i1.p1 TRINITY_DN68418_c0_g1~~TRINITY_DN68418_c0_g1_i1.p1  ORF type:complete len:328 (+),score=108.78 TRINITY_DN68418_c0_g1_i1:41-985(+)
MGIVASYLHATRPWSLTAGAIPVIVTAAAVEKEIAQHAGAKPFWQAGSFYAVFACVMLVQMGANLTNTYWDFVQKLDVLDHNGECGDATLVKPKEGVTARGVLLVSIACYAAASALVALLLPQALVVFAVGALLSFSYTASPISLKYRALGDVVVFLCFGPLLLLFTESVVTPDLVVQSSPHEALGAFSVYSLPLALFTEAILHANNGRDIESDTKAGCLTLAALIGFDASFALFLALVSGAYLSVLYIAFTAHWGCVATLLTAPLAVSLVKTFSKSANMTDLPVAVAQTHLPFGVLMFLGVYFTDSGIFQVLA